VALPNESATETVQIPIGDGVGTLQSFHEQTGISVATVIRVAWGLVIHAFTGQESICFGDLAASSGKPTGVSRSVCRMEFGDSVLVSELLQAVEVTSAGRRGLPEDALVDVPHAEMVNTGISFMSVEIQKSGKTQIAVEEVTGDCDSEVSDRAPQSL
jgi:hypothetical protein